MRFFNNFRSTCFFLQNQPFSNPVGCLVLIKMIGNQNRTGTEPSGWSEIGTILGNIGSRYGEDFGKSTERPQSEFPRKVEISWKWTLDFWNQIWLKNQAILKTWKFEFWTVWSKMDLCNLWDLSTCLHFASSCKMSESMNGPRYAASKISYPDPENGSLWRVLRDDSAEIKMLIVLILPDWRIVFF